MKRDLSALDRNICQPLGRIIQEAFADGIHRVFSEDATYAYGLQVYPEIKAGASPTLGYFTGQFIYMQDKGSATITNWMGLMLGLKINTTPSGDSAFIRVYSHGTKAVGSVLFMANSSGTPITNLLDFEGKATPVEANEEAGNKKYRVKCKMHDTTCYLALYDG